MSWDLESISSTYLHAAFMPVAPQSVRTKSSCLYLFTLFGIYVCKSCTKNIDEIEPRLPLFTTIIGNYPYVKFSILKFIGTQRFLLDKSLVTPL
jgi:hypothetical protein